MTDERQIHQVSLILGGLQTAVTNLTEQWREQDRKATESRRLLYQEFATLKDKISEKYNRLEAEMENMSVDINEMKPAIRDWVHTHDQGIGASKMAQMIGKVVYIAAGAVVAALSWTVAYLWPHGR